MTKFIKDNKISIGLIILAFIPFAYLGINILPIIIWDEAIYANNALEMAMSGDPLVLKVNGVSDLYNTKPPFVIWCQSICIQVFGGNELAIRLPSLLSVFGLAILLFFFLKKNFETSRLGLITVLVLFTSLGYMRGHVAMTGDLDAMLVFWVTFFSLPLFHLTTNAKTGINRIIYLGGFGFLMAYMTKSTAALLPLPGLFLILLLSKQLKYILLNKVFYFLAISIIIFIASYYFLREWMLPDGYWEKVYFSEFKRYTEEIMSWHKQPFHFYFENLITKKHFTPYIYILPICMIFGLLNQNSKLKKLTIYASVFVLSYLLIISYPSVKLEWYDAPIYPFLSILIGIGIHTILEKTTDKIKFKNRQTNKIITIIILSLLFAFPYYQAIQQNNNKQLLYKQDEEGYTIRELKEIFPKEKSYKVIMQYPEIHERNIDQGNFYIRSYNHFKDYEIELIQNMNSLKRGDKVLVCQDEVTDTLASKFDTISIHQNQYCSFVELGKLKD